MTFEDLRREFRRCGLTVTSKGLCCTFCMKNAEKITNVVQGEQFIQATFSDSKHIVKISVIKK